MKHIFSAIKKGIPILIYESSEDEISVGLWAEKLTKKRLIVMKKYATSDIGVILPHQVANHIELPYLNDLIEKMPYNKKKSSLSVLLDHKDAKTGSRDEDKLLLIKEFVKAAKTKKYDKLCSSLVVPGHLRFFIGKKGLLNERIGHTELFISSGVLAGIEVERCIFVIATLRDSNTGKIIKVKDLPKYKELSNLPITNDKEIYNLWKEKYGKK